MESHVFDSCIKLENIYFRSTKPIPFKYDYFFYEAGEYPYSIYVPRGTKDAYIQAGWSVCKEVVEY